MNQQKKTALLLAPGFEEVEALTVVDLLRRAGFICDMVAVRGGTEVVGSHGIVVKSDCAFSNADFSTYDGVILPGGMPGTTNLAADQKVISILQDYSSQGKLTAAICAAPTVLAKAGLLEGKKAVCYPGMESQLTGALAGNPPVQRDGTVITSQGVGTAIPFGLEIIRYLDCTVSVEKLADSIVYQGVL